MDHAVSYAVERATERWSFTRKSEHQEFYTILGTGSLIAGALISYADHRLAQWSRTALFTVGAAAFVKVLYKMVPEQLRLERFLTVRAKQRPGFYPYLKRYLELKFGKRNITYPRVDEVTSDIIQFVEMATGSNFKIYDKEDFEILQVLENLTARIEKTFSSSKKWQDDC